MIISWPVDDFGVMTYEDIPNPQLTPCSASDGHWWYREKYHEVRRCNICDQWEKHRITHYTANESNNGHN